MATAKVGRITVEDMAQRGILVSITASEEGCEWGEDAAADIIMNQAQRTYFSSPPQFFLCELTVE